ncbi:MULTISPECIES: helix-turn-helix domain-containing protein [Phaeobacter]|uniref:helix-turn-helix domain-containing protein n=1 Tax=Phaeobacter TaxID=302485 RepID=UPI003A8AF10E
MSALRPFREIQLQWLSQLVQDQDLSPRTIQVAAYIVLEHYNHRLAKAWPSFDRISKALGITKKTVQRAVSELKGKWFEITHGNGLRHSTEYVPSKQSHAAAQKIREDQEERKRDNIVSLRPAKGGHSCPERETNSSAKEGQDCPLTKGKKQNKETGASRTGPQVSELRLHFVPTSICFARDWSNRLEEVGLPALGRLLPEELHGGKRGFWLPDLNPAPRGSSQLAAQIAAVKRLAGHVPVNTSRSARGRL